MRGNCLIAFYQENGETGLRIAEILEGKGHFVKVFSDQESLLADESLKESDLILVQAGNETLKRIIDSLKSTWLSTFTPVLLILRDPSRELRVFALEHGASDILNIPFSEEEFLVRVNSLLRVKFLYDELENESLELQRSHAETRTEKMQMEAMLEAMGDGVILLTNEGVVRMINTSARKMLGLGRDEKITSKTLAKCKFNPTVVLQQALSTNGDLEPLEITVDTPGRAYLLARFWPVEDHLGRTVGKMIVLTDITKDKTEELSKTRFVMEVSHELRTPLTSISSALSILSSSGEFKTNPKSKEFLDVAVSNVKRMTWLVLKLVDYSRIGSDSPSRDQGSVEIVSLLREILDSIRPQLTRRNVEVCPEFHSEPLFVRGEKERLKSVLEDLLGTFLKLAKMGEAISLRTRTDSEKGGEEKNVLIEFSDLRSSTVGKELRKLVKGGSSSVDDPGVILPATNLGFFIACRVIENEGGAISFGGEDTEAPFMKLKLPVKVNDDRSVEDRSSLPGETTEEVLTGDGRR